MIIARIESLVAGRSMEEALERAGRYVEAGADGIMIHSSQKTADEVTTFAHRFRSSHPDVPLICVPTSYASVHTATLHESGFNIVIYANHMMRSSYKAMEHVARELLIKGRAHDIEEHCVSVSQVLALFS